MSQVKENGLRMGPFATCKTIAGVVTSKVRLALEIFGSSYWLGGAILSRLIIVVFSVISNLLIVDHFPGADVSAFAINISKVSPFKASLIRSALKSFSKWDSAYYLQIAKDGKYVIDQQLAFFPLYPFLIRLTSHTLHRVVSNYAHFQSGAMTLLVFLLSGSYSTESIIADERAAEALETPAELTPPPMTPADRRRPPSDRSSYLTRSLRASVRA